MCGCGQHKCFITLQTPTNGTLITLPDSSRIRNGTVNSIMLRRSGSATLKTITGATVASDAVIATGNLTLVDLNGQQIFAPLPLSSLQRDYNYPEPYRGSWKNIDLTQTTINIEPDNDTDVVEVIFGLDCEFCNV